MLWSMTIRALLKTCLYFCFILQSFIPSIQAGTCFSHPNSLAVLNDASPPSNAPSHERPPNTETPRRNSRNGRTFKGQVFDRILLRGTTLYASLKLGTEIPLGPSTQGSSIAQLAFRLANYVVSLRDDELLTRVDVWPTYTNPLKFEIKHAADAPELCDEASQLNKAFLGSFALFLHNDVSLGWTAFDYDFAGNVTTASGAVLYSFRVFLVDRDQARPEKLDGVTFGRQDLRAVFAAKDQIVEHTQPDDILLFLGNTAA